MGITKTEAYNSLQIQIANQLKALGHPARIAIVELILQKQSCICGDLVLELPLAQPTISQHLKELKAVGIIKGEVLGKSICYCLDEAVIESIGEYFKVLISLSKKRKSNCC